MFSIIFFICSVAMFIVIPIILIYAILRPEKLHIRTSKNENGKYSRKKFYLVIVFAWILFLLIRTWAGNGNYYPEDFETTQDDQSDPTISLEVDDDAEKSIYEFIGIDSNSQVEEQPIEAKSKTFEDGTFNVTLDELDKNLEDLTKEMGLYDASEGKTDSYIISEGGVEDTFTEKFSESVIMVGVLSKSGNIKKVTVTKNKTLETGDQIEDLITALGAMAVGLDTNLDLKTSMDAFTYLVQSSKYQFEAEGSSEQRASIGNIIYIARMSEETNTQVTLLPYQ